MVMVRGVFATTAAIALALGVNLSAFDQHGQSGQHGNSGSTHGASSSHSTGTTSTSGTSTSSMSGTSSTTTTTGGTLSPVQQKLQSHTQLASKLQSRLPGTNVVTAAGGFRNLGQFVAAVNVSHNLRIPFSQLKTDMVTKHMSLGQAIQTLRPTANSTQEVERAQTQARQMMDADDGK
jgi:hypothetical protein